ncbi:optineurin [Lingula anatina]|uniref:Optineurin n=1 Tax=Lingula anatina TaxID=7574 RepID=A0A1S3JF70_LINAN|nr:optineurin [Lingula anatina]|eukprot:XP_013408796.1 optineurin [Lingula anatina]
MEVNGNNGPPSGSSAGSDFVILSRVTSPSNRGDSPVNLEHLTFSLQSLASELTQEETLARMKDLMQENQELKSTVMQNTEAMRSQRSIIEEWKKKIEASQQETRNRYNDARRVVTNLRQQRDEAQKKILALEAQIREGVAGTTGTDMLQLQHKIEELEQTNQKLIKNADDSNNLIEALNAEIQNLKKTHPSSAGGESYPSDGSPSQKAELHVIKVKQEAAETQAKEYQSQVQQLQEQLQTFKQEIEDLTEEKQRMAQKRAEIGEAMTKMETQNKDLKAKLDESSTELSKIREMQQRLLLEKKDLLTMNTQLQAELSELKQNIMAQSTGTDDFAIVDKKECHLDQNMAASDREAVEVESTQQQGQGHAQVVSRPGQGQAEEGSRLLSGDSAVESGEMNKLLEELEEERQKVTSLSAQLQETQAKIESLSQDLQDKEKELSDSATNTDRRVRQLTEEHNKQVKELMTRIESMSMELQQRKDRNPEEGIQPLRAQLMSVLNELQETQQRCNSFEQRFLTTNEKLEAAMTNLEKERGRYREADIKLKKLRADVDDQRTKDDTVIDQMRITITNLELALNMERQEGHTAKQQLAEMRHNFDQLCKDYHDLLGTFDDYKAGQEAKNSALSPEMQKENMSLKIDVDNLTAQLIAAEESLDNKRNEIDGLRQQIGQLQTAVEAIPVWKAQAEVYKKDFEAERASREQQNEEKEKLREELNQQQIQNQQLLDELETFNRRQLESFSERYRHQPYIPGVNRPPSNYTPPQLPPNQYPGQQYPRQQYPGQQYPGQHVQAPPHMPYGSPYFRQNYLNPDVQGEQSANEGGPRSGDSDQWAGSGRRSTSTEEQEFVCPKCQDNFPDLDSLQIHVTECLDQD